MATYVLVVVLSLTFLTSCQSADLAEGQSAYEAGNYRLALDHLRPLAEEGNAQAQYTLGEMYFTGRGVAVDMEEGARWVHSAAKQGSATAQFRLGRLYWLTNPTEAINWYRQAAEQGHREAQLYLGFAYAEGRGVEENKTDAAMWYRKAAEQSQREAQYFLAEAYSVGAGIATDEAEAAEWWRKAAELGNPDAPVKLGALYARGGSGILRDPIQAYMWFSVAPPDDDRVEPQMSGLASQMAEAQVVEARRLADEWTQRYPLIEEEYRAVQEGAMPLVP